MVTEILELIPFWKGPISVNGTQYEDISQARLCDCGSVSSIILHRVPERAVERNLTRLEADGSTVYRITVRQYMTRPSSPDFDFMKSWNNDVPMPLRTMVGTVEKETRGMVYMKLHGDITSRITQHCMRCGRPITNPVSQFFGMGPECGGHNYVNPFESEDELREVVEEYRKNYLQKIVWEGWVIKSAIIEQEVIE